MISHSITKSVDIEVSLEKAFDFLKDPLNWPRWAIVNLKSVTEDCDGWFRAETRMGIGRLKVFAQKKDGILDHQWNDPQASWTVPARVVVNGNGVTFLITFFQPPTFSDDMFAAALKETELELSTLRQVLEGETTAN
jgi:hypothetical protein